MAAASFLYFEFRRDGDFACLTRASFPRNAIFAAAVVVTLSLAAMALPRHDKDVAQYGAGLIVNVPFPESEVVQVVQDVVQNGIIRGTKEYAKDEYVRGATVVSATRAFPESTEGGKAFYKVRLKALDPWNFKDSSDVGTLAVRYVVQGQDATHTVVRIDARFVEDFRRISHPSNGSVEGAEYKSIHDRLESLATMKAETAEAKRIREESVKPPVGVLKDESPKAESAAPPQTEPTIAAPASPAPDPLATSAPVQNLPAQSLEDRVKDLRHQVERLVKAPGAPLKSAPFHTASTIQSLASGTEVLVVISTPYWLGIETHDGQHGWILRDDLELLP